MLSAYLLVWRSRSVPVFLLIVLIPLLLPSAGLAQTARGLAGSVLDPDGKAVVGAAVVVRNEASGVVRTVMTDDHGAFALGDLVPASYAVEVLVPGFETVRRGGVRVAGDPVTTLSIQLSIANSGPAHARSLHVFRVDSPMKGKYSAQDERQLSFHVATVDTSSLQMTVRECLWNQGVGIHWGAAVTVDLRPASEQRDERADRHERGAQHH